MARTDSVNFDFDVFLSHSRKDIRSVTRVATFLRNAGFRVWFDEWEVRPGDPIAKRIIDGLQHSRVLLPMMSPSFFDSEWVSLESHTFIFRDPTNRTRRFVPVLLEDTEIPDALRQFRYVDLRARGPASLQKVADALNQYSEPRVRHLPPSGSSAQSVQDRILAPALHSFTGHSGNINSILALAEGGFLSASADGTVRLWDATVERCLRVFEGHEGPINHLCVTAGYVLSASADCALRIWDMRSGQAHGVLRGHTAPVNCVTPAFHGARAITAAADGSLRIWSLRDLSCIGMLKGHQAAVNCVTLTNDGRAISGAADSVLRLWDIQRCSCLAVMEGHLGPINAVAHAEPYIVSAGADGAVGIWHAATGERVALCNIHSAPVSRLAVTSDLQHVITAANDHRLCLLSTADGRQIAEFIGHTGSVLDVAVNVRGQVISASADHTVRVWESRTRQCLGVFQGHTAAVSRVTFTMSGREAISGSFDTTLKRWRIPS